MSKILRCKNDLKNYDLDWIEEQYGEKNVLRFLDRQHGDRRSGRRNASKEFRNDIEKTRRRKDKRALYKALKLEEHDESFSPRKRNANWEYF